MWENRIDIKRKKDGFESYVDILSRVHGDLFIKQLNLQDVNVIFNEEIELKYEGIFFQLFSSTLKKENIEDNKFMLFTDSEKLAQKYDFEKKEQFVFSKEIAKDQIESIRILQKPIKEFEAYGVKETIIEKEDVDAWLNSIFLL